MKKIFSLILLSVVALLSVEYASAQVTTSSMAGVVTDQSNQEALIGVTVIATHEPSGTTYGAVTNPEGRYSIQGMRSGGPYSIEYSYIGYKTAVVTDINLELGNSAIINMELGSDTQNLEDVVVVYHGSKFAGVKTGSSTNISGDQLESMPTVSRSISDFTRLSPYAGSGSSFGGQDSAYNNFNVDGANLNSNFFQYGLPGGGNPISLDAIEEVQVAIAPYDVRQANFVGAGINAVTKSGTNQFKGSAYAYTTNENMRGNSINGDELGKRETEKSTTYGFTLGGPIVKDKLFFFTNAEYVSSPKPVFKWRTSEDGVADETHYESRVTQEDMDAYAAILRDQYGYEPGSSTNFDSDVLNYKVLARIDWNINNKNKFTTRYNFTQNSKTNQPSPSVPNKPTSSSAHVNQYSMAFRSNCYNMINAVHSLTAELNSNLSENMSNQVLVAYTKVDDYRSSDSEIFPHVDIMKDGEMFMSAGYELYTPNNAVVNNTLTITDNFNWNLSKHAITAGLSYENQYVSNSFMGYGYGYYRYESLEAFERGDAPVVYGLTYGYDGQSEPKAIIKFGQASAYVQDTWSPLENLKLTYGVRLDYTMYLNDLIANKTIDACTFANGEKVSTGDWPGSNLIASPRVGWNWDVFSDHKLTIRGGTGLFAGRIPFNYFTNIPTNSGMIQNSLVTFDARNADDKAVLDRLTGGVKSAEEVQKILSDVLPSSAGDGHMSGNIATVSKDFKLPQVWKSSLAADLQLGLSFPATLTAEAMYTKNINAVTQRNINVIPLSDEAMDQFSGEDNRYIYPDDSKIYNEATGVYVLDNTNKGYSYTLNTTLNMRPAENLSMMFAYTHTAVKELSSNPGSQAHELYNNIPSVNGANYLDLRDSEFTTPNRVVASLMYRLPYANNFASSIGLIYTGYNTGNYSYMYSNDMNNDGVSADLMYIPSTKDELTFVDSANFSADEQREAFWSFVNQDPYLREHKGEYAGAYGARKPWVNRFDLKFTQDFYIKTKNQTNTLQLSVDVLNIGNLINDKWGVSQFARNNGKILKYEGADSNNTPTFSMYSYSEAGKPVLPKSTFDYTHSSTECWQLQIGLKYLFN